MRGRRLAVLGCALALGTGVAQPAAAKSDLELTVIPIMVGPQDAHEVGLSAVGGDDAAGPQRLCLQQGSAAGWRDLVCGTVRFATGGTVRALVPVPWISAAWFRAELDRVGPGPGGRTVSAPDLVSAPQVVLPPPAVVLGAGIVLTPDDW
jgi:hypothetical protein